MKKIHGLIVPNDVKAIVITKDVDGESQFPNAENIVAVMKKKKGKKKKPMY